MRIKPAQVCKMNCGARIQPRQLNFDNIKRNLLLECLLLPHACSWEENKPQLLVTEFEIQRYTVWEI